MIKISGLCESHHHKARGSSFGESASRTEGRRRGCTRRSKSVLFAQRLAVELVVVISEYYVALLTAEAVRVELLFPLSLQVLSLDAAIATCTQ